MSSSPATIRSAVVLPQPDGPTSTMNSPSAMLTAEVLDGVEAVLVDLVDLLQAYRGHDAPPDAAEITTAHPFTAPEVRPEITNLRKMKTRMPMGTTATTLAAKMVP